MHTWELVEPRHQIKNEYRLDQLIASKASTKCYGKRECRVPSSTAVSICRGKRDWRFGIAPSSRSSMFRRKARTVAPSSVLQSIRGKHDCRVARLCLGHWVGSMSRRRPNMKSLIRFSLATRIFEPPHRALSSTHLPHYMPSNTLNDLAEYHIYHGTTLHA